MLVQSEIGITPFGENNPIFIFLKLNADSNVLSLANNQPKRQIEGAPRPKALAHPPTQWLASLAIGLGLAASPKNRSFAPLWGMRFASLAYPHLNTPTSPKRALAQNLS